MRTTFSFPMIRDSDLDLLEEGLADPRTQRLDPRRAFIGTFKGIPIYSNPAVPPDVIIAGPSSRIEDLLTRAGTR